MQNKGFVKVFAVLLALVCVFYLSFTLISRHYDKRAEAYSEGNSEKYYAYLDSLAGDKVWLGYTLKECREKELNLGLDLKGGMNVVMEVSVADILKSLAGNNSETELFQKTISLAKEKQKKKQANFVDLFAEALKEVDPSATLATLFSSYELKDRVTLASTDAEVKKVLNEHVKSAVDNSFNVLRSRIDRFGVVQPNIQQLDIAGRILIEMPGIKEPERVRKLLQGSANLEFWETADFSEIYNSIIAANQMVIDLNAAASKKEEPKEVAEAKKDTTATSVADSLLANLESNTQDTLASNDAVGNSLFSILAPNMSQGRIGFGALIGYAAAKDTAKVAEYLRLAKEKRIIPANIITRWSVKPINDEYSTSGGKQLYELIALKCRNREGKAPLDGSVITDARADFGQHGGEAHVSMEMNQEGAKTWARLTKANVGKQVAIVLDEYVYSYPRVNNEITGGRSEITGNFTVAEAKDLANVLKSGKMPAPAKIIQEDVVGPSLGQEAIDSGLFSFIVAFGLVLLYMIAYYGLIPGLVADVALLTNVFLIFGALASFKAVLTLPGIAGVVLTLGMAVDANVLIYERIREELRGGKPMAQAISDGYGNALSAIIDSNVTTILTGIILFWFGTGPIRGFATTLIIGILSSFFTAIFISRIIIDFLLKKGKLDNLSFCTALSKGMFQNLNFDFIGKRKMFYCATCIYMLIFIGSLVVNGLKPGIDFSGGRNYIVRFEKPISTTDVQQSLSGKFGDDFASVITIGDANQVRISTNYKIDDESESTDSEIEGILYESLKGFLSNGVSRDMFVNRYELDDNGIAKEARETTEATFGIQSSQKVGPTMADDIKTSAYWSVGFALLVIALYIFIRFRNVAFSAGALVSLTHDALFILGLYSLLYSVMPFSMEIDQSFIAAILTVIGYSINDTVVIFDRIRENIGLHSDKDNKWIVNMSINSTLSRTFSTTLSTLIVLLAIFIFGGETIRGFIFAMTVGVVAGTYSTIVVASPIAFDLLGRKKFASKAEDAKAEAVKAE